MSLNIIDTKENINLEDLLEKYEDLKKNNITNNKITKYERATIIGTRSQQLALGCPPLIDMSSITTDSVIQIAEQELEQKKIPFILQRKVADKYEYWKIEDMIL